MVRSFIFAILSTLVLVTSGCLIPIHQTEISEGNVHAFNYEGPLSPTEIPDVIARKSLADTIRLENERWDEQHCPGGQNSHYCSDPLACHQAHVERLDRLTGRLVNLTTDLENNRMFSGVVRNNWPKGASPDYSARFSIEKDGEEVLFERILIPGEEVTFHLPKGVVTGTMSLIHYKDRELKLTALIYRAGWDLTYREAERKFKRGKRYL